MHTLDLHQIFFSYIKYMESEAHFWGHMSKGLSFRVNWFYSLKEWCDLSLLSVIHCFIYLVSWLKALAHSIWCWQWPWQMSVNMTVLSTLILEAAFGGFLICPLLALWWANPKPQEVTAHYLCPWANHLTSPSLVFPSLGKRGLFRTFSL